VLAEMTNPAKVLAFLDLFGAWDPSLAFVMASALAVTALGYRLVWRWSEPLLAPDFQLPKATRIDRRLVIGGALFGAGWGLVGLCPGPALAVATVGGPKALVFVAAMIAGMIASDRLARAGA
ncbi:MAG: DUF6691 family protein, partial [Thalassobaculaceae bacterium]